MMTAICFVQSAEETEHINMTIKHLLIVSSIQHPIFWHLTKTPRLVISDSYDLRFMRRYTVNS